MLPQPCTNVNTNQIDELENGKLMNQQKQQPTFDEVPTIEMSQMTLNSNNCNNLNNFNEPMGDLEGSFDIGDPKSNCKFNVEVGGDSDIENDNHSPIAASGINAHMLSSSEGEVEGLDDEPTRGDMVCEVEPFNNDYTSKMPAGIDLDRRAINDIPPLMQQQQQQVSHDIHHHKQQQQFSNVSGEWKRQVEDQFMGYFKQKIAPTRTSENKRKAIFNKVKQLIENAYDVPVHVLRYGSDPLKTYMPDSDIDITVIPSLSAPQPSDKQKADSDKPAIGSSLAQLRSIFEQLENFQQQRWEIPDQNNEEQQVNELNPNSQDFQVTPNVQTTSNFVAKQQQQQQDDLQHSSQFQISQLQLVDQADVEIIKLTIADTMVDISIKQVGGFCTVLFVEKMCTKCSFLKDSICLLKAWMTYEASLLGSHAANMATYALYVMVIFIVNNFEVKGPMDVFRVFFEYFGGHGKGVMNSADIKNGQQVQGQQQQQAQSAFDWDQNMISIYGPVRTHNFYDRLKNEFNFDMDKFALFERSAHFVLQPLKTSCPIRQTLLLTPEDLEDLQVQITLIRCILNGHVQTPNSAYYYAGLGEQQATGSEGVPSVESLIGLQPVRKAMNLKFINLVDPCNQLNNLGKSISLFNSHRFREAIKWKATQLQQSDPMSPQAYFNELIDTWKFTFECCNVLPPLSLQMPQIDESPAASNFADFCLDFEEATQTNHNSNVHNIQSQTEGHGKVGTVELVDVEATLRRRNHQLKMQLELHGIQLSHFQLQQLETQFEDGFKLKSDIGQIENEQHSNANDLITMLGGGLILKVLNNQPDHKEQSLSSGLLQNASGRQGNQDNSQNQNQSTVSGSNPSNEMLSGFKLRQALLRAK